MRHVTLRVEPGGSGRDFADGAIGFSIEDAELETQDLSASHGSLVALMRLLGPGVLRVGGNSLDVSWWTSGNEPRPAWATYVITPADLVRLRGLLVAAHWRVILGVDLGHFDPSRAADEAVIAERTLGSRLLGFEAGNEPDSYGNPPSALRPSTYGAASYLQELGAYTAAIRAEVPAMRLFGPDLSNLDWLPTIAADKQTSIDVITQHFYPTTYSFSSGVCSATSVPTALDLLSPQVRALEDGELRALAAAGKIAHRETWISETNTTSSCDANGGPETSPVFASALWSLDWALRSASSGVSGIDFHGWVGSCGADAFSPTCASTEADMARGSVTPRPEYYGLFAARQLEGGHFLPVQIGKRASDDLTAYATLHADRVITVAIDNVSKTRSVALSLQVPGYATATEETLTAPSIGATHGVTFGGASFNLTGGLRSKTTPAPKVNGGFQLQVAPASAYIVTVLR